jgi:sulfate adenylyltransferase
VLAACLAACGRTVTVLDGDVVRMHLSAGLGFSREDRNTNVRRIGFVASEIVRHGGAVICAAVSPYRAIRDECRQMIGSDHFVEVFVDTPLQVCEQRDPKGLYAKARQGRLKNFTGIDDPYEPPLCADLTLDTVHTTAESNALLILSWVARRGLVVADWTLPEAASQRRQ